MADGVEEKTYSAKQVATRIGTDAKQLRKFFRDEKSGYTPVGQGGRYDFPESEVSKIKEAFDAWSATKTRRNRSPERKLAEGAGIIPRQRKESPGTDASPPRPRRLSPAAMAKAGLHGNAMDEDTLQDRFKGIAARAQKHGLVPKGGRLVPGPRKPEPEKFEYPDLSTIPGLDGPEPQWLDFRDQAEIEEELKQRAFAEFLEEAQGDSDDEELDFDEEDVEDL